MLPKLFKAWDLDGNGYIDQRELFMGLGRYCRMKNVPVKRQSILSILMVVDINHDHRLDEREFSVFLARFADSLNISLFDLTYSIMEYLAEKQSQDLESAVAAVEQEQQKEDQQLREEKASRHRFRVLDFFRSLQEEQVRRQSLC